MILLDSEEIGVRAARRPIMSSIRFLTNHTDTIALCGLPGPRATGKEPWLHTTRFSGRSHSCPRFSLSTLPGIPRYPSLTAPAHPRSAPPTYRQASQPTVTMTSGSIEPVLLISALLGNIRRRGRVALPASTFFSGV